MFSCEIRICERNVSDGSSCVFFNSFYIKIQIGITKNTHNRLPAAIWKMYTFRNYIDWNRNETLFILFIFGIELKINFQTLWNASIIAVSCWSSSGWSRIFIPVASFFLFISVVSLSLSSSRFFLSLSVSVYPITLSVCSSFPRFFFICWPCFGRGCTRHRRLIKFSVTNRLVCSERNTVMQPQYQCLVFQMHDKFQCS